MDNDLISVCKSAIATGVSPVSRQFILKRLDDIAEERRQPHQSHAQAYAKFLETPDGLTLYRASTIAQFVDYSESAPIRKAMADDIHSTVSQRLAKCAVDLQASSPHMSDQEAIAIVLKRNPEGAAALRREHGLEPVAKGDDSATRRLVNAAAGLVRQKVVGSHDEAMRRTIVANPKLHARALAEVDADDEVGKSELVSLRKGNIRVNKSAAANDATQRLQAIIQRLVDSGLDAKAAEFRAKSANPELWEMSCGAPDGAEDLSVDSSNYMPRKR
jgi:hypothetical protein